MPDIRDKFSADPSQLTLDELEEVARHSEECWPREVCDELLRRMRQLEIDRENDRLEWKANEP